VRATRARMGDRIPGIAVFDTGFHHSLPDRARLYAIPWELTCRHQIRRYGFHGISHKYLLLRYAELTKTPVDQTRIITLHLEGGSSATAIVGGRSIDTSMGFTPLEGLVMGTRSGDIDPALVTYLAEKESVSSATVEEWLNKKSGMLGVSGESQDTRVLVKSAAENKRADLALEIFSYRVRKYIGAYLAATGGVAAIVFGGGIGENTPDVRRRICEGLDWFGLEFDEAKNNATIDRVGRITRDGSRIHAYVIPTDEGLMIAHEALLCFTHKAFSAKQQSK
jgi:acetate kinase